MAEGGIRNFIHKLLPQKENQKERPTRIIVKTNNETHFIDENCTYKSSP
jgi:hypothetical protein